MDRRSFIATAGAAVASAALPSPNASQIAVDLASMPDETVFRLVQYQRGAFTEVYRVTGIPRYQMGRDTWTDQIEAGLGELVEKDVNKKERD